MDARHGETFQRYLAGGLSLVPCGQDKRPVIKWKEYQQRTPTPAELDRWLQTDAEAFAAVCGQVSGGLEIIDFDNNADALPMAYSAIDFYDAWRDEVGALVDHYGLVVQRTGGGGFQVAYRCPTPSPNQKLAWVQDEAQEHGRSIAIETRGEGGYALVAPSLHPSGNFYRTLAGDFAAVPIIPQEIRDRLIEAARALDLMPYTAQEVTQVKAANRTTRYPDQISIIDTYNDQHRIADVLAAHGYTRGRNGRYSRPGKDDSLGVAVIERENISFHWSSNDPLNKTNAAGKPVPIDPFNVFTLFDHRGDVREAVKDAARILRIDNTRRVYTNGHHPEPDAPTNDAPPDDSYLLVEGTHDEGNAQCVHKRHQGQFLHSESLGWIRFTSTHWTIDEAESTVERAITETLIARMQAGIQTDPVKYADMIKRTVPNSSKVQSAKSQLRSLVSVSVNQFDTEADYLNCPNGLVNLRTGAITPHSPSQRFMHCTTVPYIPTADQSGWCTWLTEAVGSVRIAQWLQLAVGYSLTGHTREEVLFYLYGPPRSGKGTFTETLLALLGSPLAKEVNFATFTAQRTGDSQNFDLAPLKPCRFLAASESNSYERFNEAKVKALTGGNEVYCAYKHQTHFNYRPQFKIWLSSNQPVNADPDDDAVWGRLRLVEFPHSHLGKEDKALKAQMRSVAMLEGVLAWAIEGAMAWYALGSQGLPELESSAQQKGEQRAELDNVQTWIDERCQVKDDAFGLNAELYMNYESWSKANGVEPKKQKSFSQSLKRKGFRDDRSTVAGKQVRGFVGIRLI